MLRRDNIYEHKFIYIFDRLKTSGVFYLLLSNEHLTLLFLVYFSVSEASAKEKKERLLTSFYSKIYHSCLLLSVRINCLKVRTMRSSRSQ
jgi:hypothetical protein